jgi:prevent-host-death family protein
MKRPFVSRASESRGPAYRPTSGTIQVAEDIIPIAELKARLSEMVRSLDSRRPLIITLNGKPAAVLMAPREFDRLTSQARVIAAVNEGLSDIEAGRVFDAEEVFDELEAEFARPPKSPRKKRAKG